MLKHASTYEDMERLSQGTLTARIAGVLRILDLSTFHPLILAVNAMDTDGDQKTELFKLIESYVVRREICGLTTKNYNKVITGLVKQLRDAPEPLVAFRQHLAELMGDASRMPTDLEVAEAFARRRAYGVMPTPRLRYILEQIEYGTRTRFDEVMVATTNLTVEHVMPRKWATHWPLANGSSVPVESSFEATVGNHVLTDEQKAQMDARQRAIDTLGNLTLLTEALNPSIGNGKWAARREKIAKALLALNREIATVEAWSEPEIAARARRLAATSNRVWPSA
ncbi:HNH endonuclease family protein [Mesorhizobium sp.]|uniref:HNH endonuclease family protein n=1 Tax=Mesorhizobium sp. TaxID=1871066 RepID=UPI0025C0278C|nr:HNH endonuclease family protein [Mesorhizobium sp.]